MQLLKAEKILFVLFILLNDTVFAQDIILLTNGTKVEARVKAVTPGFVIYKKYSHLDGPDYKEYKKHISNIRYSNGEIERFDRDERVLHQDSGYIEDKYWGRRKGAYFGAWGGIGAGFITRAETPVIPKLSFNGGFLYKNNLTNHVGLITGINIAHIHCTLYSNYKETIYSPGIKDEVNGYINYFSVPVLFSVTTGNNGRLNINPEAGFLFGGVFSHYYRHSAVTSTTSNHSVKIVNFYLSLNLSYPLSEKFTLSIGPYVVEQVRNSFTSIGGNFKLWYKFNKK